jgi:hypothetical protein
LVPGFTRIIRLALVRGFTLVIRLALVPGFALVIRFALVPGFALVIRFALPTRFRRHIPSRPVAVSAKDEEAILGGGAVCTEHGKGGDEEEDTRMRKLPRAMAMQEVHDRRLPNG